MADAGNQNASVDAPDQNRPNRLDPVNPTSDQKTGAKTDREESKTQPQEPGICDRQCGNRGKPEKNGARMPGLQLTFLEQIHSASNAGQGKRSTGHHRK